MAKVNNNYIMYNAKEVFDGNFSKRIITINSKLNFWTLIFGISECVFIWFYAMPILCHSFGEFIFTKIILITLCVTFSFMIIICVLWMILGKEKIILIDNQIFDFKTLFGIPLVYKCYVYEYTSSWNVNTDFPDDLNQSKWRIVRIINLSYNAYSLHAAYGFSGGKILFSYSNRIERIASNVDELSASKILKYINVFFGNKYLLSNQSGQNKIQMNRTNRKSFDLISILSIVSLILFVLVLLLVILKQ